MESSVANISYIITYFFWFASFINLIYKLNIAFRTCQNKQLLFTLECIYCWHIWKNLFQLFAFCNYFCWSVICMNLVSKFHNLFPTYPQTDVMFIFDGFQYCHLWKVQFQLSITFFTFFVWFINCSSHFFIYLFLVSKLYELSL